ncbi:Excinuclease ABC subunit C [Thermomonospora echinospora]|uniref:UvrABC system protein C n=1 Tax=Thermomonospora echinospora TaxID=1992 RepID=A0A1H6BX53_9ACTN|nr:excinuclease ABC subunit UvrC [Thermomonospora echinospora]SEG64756.1 Excinuclease ABC subunit C [Thermomonospora echinospora]
MADPANYRPAPGSVPDSPGVYRFRDEHGRVIYVGKAKSLRSRLNSYFADFAGLHPRTQTMLQTATRVDWTVVGTEVEALQLEYSWIKEFDPRFNVRYRDDKSYPYLAVTLDEEFPRVMVMRGAKRKGVRYFGPYSHAWAIRETVDLLLRVFPVRTCKPGVFKRARQIDRPCLLGYIDKCSAPCVGRVDAAEHRRLAEDFCAFMAGDTGRFIKRIEREMLAAAEAEEYERAARLRDDMRALQRALEKQAVVLGDDIDCDVIAFAEDPLEAAVQVFYVRGGRIRGQRGWVVDKVEDVTTADLVEHFLGQIYGEGEQVPREVLVPAEPPDAEAVGELLAERRGGPVRIRVPRRGDKRALLETVARNAAEALKQHKTRRAGDLTTRSRALQEIQEALELDEAPLRIECYDVSNLQGTNVVASMVVFEDGMARKSEYRRFGIRAVQGQDDVRSIHEVITRRFKRYLAERDRAAEAAEEAAHGEATDASAEEAADGVLASYGFGDADEQDGAPAGPVDPRTGRARKFAYPPNLVVVDGGPPQVAAAQRALDELGVPEIAVCGLAKRMEEIWLPGDEEPVILPRGSEGLFLMQRLRDEAHRFAITYHRQRRSKEMTASELDGVPGLGPARRAALLKHFGSLRRLRAATPDQIAEVPGIGRRTAEQIAAALHGATEGTGGPPTAAGAQEAPEDTGGRASAGGTQGRSSVNDAHGTPGDAGGRPAASGGEKAPTGASPGGAPGGGPPASDGSADGGGP